MKQTIKPLHYLYFDGTSYFVGDKSDATEETEIVETSHDENLLFAVAEELNDEIEESRGTRKPMAMVSIQLLKWNTEE